MRRALLIAMSASVALGQVTVPQHYTSANPPQEEEVLRAFVLSRGHITKIRNWKIAVREIPNGIIADCVVRQWHLTATSKSKQNSPSYYTVSEKFGGCTRAGNSGEVAYDELSVASSNNP